MFWSLGKILHFASACVNFTIGLGKKIKKMQFLVIFDLHFKNVICIILTLFLLFWLPWSQKITFYILTMVVAHSCEQEKKWKFWVFFENLKIWKFFQIFQIFKKKSKFSFFLLFTAMCYDHGEDIKSYFMTSRKPKKQNKSQNNAYNILEMKVKNN